MSSTNLAEQSGGLPKFRRWASKSPFDKSILDDRVALVTGGASGIGFEVARQLGLHGAKLLVFGRRVNFLQDACRLFAEDGISAVYCAGDVRNPDDCARAVKAAVDTFGFLNNIVNGAAGMFPASLGESMTPKGFKTVIDIDVLGTYNMSYAALGALKATGQALIVNITVPRHFLEGRNWWVGHMQSAKAAITTLSHTMAKEWAEYGIRVCNVGPGLIADTPAQLKMGSTEGISSKATDVTEDGIPMTKMVPLGRMGKSFEIAMATVYLCVSEYITAETIVVDGGWWLGGDRHPQMREQLGNLSRANEGTSRALAPGDIAKQSKM